MKIKRTRVLIPSTYDHEADNNLTTEEFIEKHKGLINHLVIREAKKLPSHLQVTMFDDLLSEAMLAAVIGDGRWVEGKKTRRNWLAYCVAKDVYRAGNKIKLKHGRTFPAGLLNRDKGDGENTEESSHAPLDIPEVLDSYLATLSAKDKLIFIRKVEGRSVRDIALEVKTRYMTVFKRIGYLQEGFVDYLKAKGELQQ